MEDTAPAASARAEAVPALARPRASLLAFGVVMVVATLVWPLLVDNVFYQRVGALVVLSALSASAWNIIGGYAGQISVGHAAFFGCGAYGALLTYQTLGWPPIAGAPFGIAAACLLAAVVGTPTFRLRGHYFTMATIAVAELVRIIVVNTPALGAAIGLSGPALPRTVFDLSFIDPRLYYWIFLAVLAVLLAVTAWLTHARLGFYLRAIRGNERAAASLGVPVRRYKLFALLLSAGFTALAGSLYACMVGFVDPDSTLGILISVNMVIVAALGGAGTLFGPLLGALILVPLEQWTNARFGGSGAGITYVVYGGIIILVSRFAPGGLIRIGGDLWHRLTRERRDRAAGG